MIEVKYDWIKEWLKSINTDIVFICKFNLDLSIGI